MYNLCWLTATLANLTCSTANRSNLYFASSLATVFSEPTL